MALVDQEIVNQPILLAEVPSTFESPTTLEAIQLLGEMLLTYTVDGARAIGTGTREARIKLSRSRHWRMFAATTESSEQERLVVGASLAITTNIFVPTLYLFGVDEMYQRQGNGTELLAFTERRLGATGAMALIIDKPSDEGAALYEKFGYKQHGDKEKRRHFMMRRLPLLSVR